MMRKELKDKVLLAIGIGIAAVLAPTMNVQAEGVDEATSPTTVDTVTG